MISLRNLLFTCFCGLAMAGDCCDIPSCGDHCCIDLRWVGRICVPGCEAVCSACKDLCDYHLPPLGMKAHVMNMAYGKALNLQNDQNKNGGSLTVWNRSEHHDQKWFIELLDGSGKLRIKNPHYNKCLNLQSHENREYGRPNVWECADHPDQQWQIFEGQLRNVHWGKCLNLQSSEDHDGGSPSVLSCTSDISQLWYFDF